MDLLGLGERGSLFGDSFSPEEFRASTPTAPSLAVEVGEKKGEIKKSKEKFFI